MIRSRKLRICLTLLAMLAASTGRGDGASTSTAPTVAPAMAYAQPQPSDGRPSSGMATATVTAANAPTAATVEYTTGFSYSSNDGGAALESALVIPGREMDLPATAQIIEDLSVMGRILEKNVLAGFGQRRNATYDFVLGARLRQDAGPQILFSSPGRPKPLYVGGYGAVFFIQVDFPLLAPAEEAQEQPAEPKEDPVWAENRRALFEPRTAPRGEAAPEPYSREKVESLRKSLIASMKHATNIRALEPGEWLTIVVQGLGSPAMASRGAPSAGLALPMVDATPAGRSVMTLRAKKADVDSYAKGGIDQTQFEQRVQATTY